MSNYTSILMIPVIMFIAGVSVVFISKIGGKAASKSIRRMKGNMGDEKESKETEAV